MAYWALEALDGSKTALSSLDRVEGTDPPAYKLGRRPHEESHFGTLPICVSRNQAQLTPCHDGVALRHCGSGRLPACSGTTGRSTATRMLGNGFG